MKMVVIPCVLALPFLPVDLLSHKIFEPTISFQFRDNVVQHHLSRNLVGHPTISQKEFTGTDESLGYLLLGCLLSLNFLRTFDWPFPFASLNSFHRGFGVGTLAL